jgi:hypothetical protein
MPIFDFDSVPVLAIPTGAERSFGEQHSRGESWLMRLAFAPTSQNKMANGRSHSRPSVSPSPVDPEISRLFTELRQYLGLPVQQISRHVSTHPNVITALEAGRIDVLPAWSETARVVTAYIGMARLDPRPALHRLSVLMGVTIYAGPPPQRHVEAPGSDHAASPVARILGRLSDAANRAREELSEPGLGAEWAAHLKETARGLRASLRAARAPVRWVSAAALGLIVIGSAAPSGVLQASVGGISQPFSGLWRKLSGQEANFRVILRGGLKWIEADDPRDRRSDKLPSRRS